MHLLTVKGIAAKTLKPGRHADGGNLYLAAKPSGARAWVFMWRPTGEKWNREMGLGPYPAVSLADAREKAAECRRLVAAGINPIEQRKAAAPKPTPPAKPAKQVPTFKTVGEEYIGAHERSWKNPKHRQQWRNTLSTYAYPIIGQKPVDAIDAAAVLDVLRPIWTAKPETASRVRMRIEAILDYARAKDLRTGDNPARWRGHLSHALPHRAKVAKVRNHPAMPYGELPAFYLRLRDRRGTAALALRFLILTAGRSSEIRLATWAEVDMEAMLWTVPETRMKAERVHRVPLSDEALAILTEVRPLATGPQAFVFPGLRDGQLSENTLGEVLERMDCGQFTAHGFRSTFRDWAGEETTHPREVAEAALAHVVGDKAEQAYRRGDALAKRRKLMDEWAAFVTGAKAQAVSIADAA